MQAYLGPYLDISNLTYDFTSTELFRSCSYKNCPEQGVKKQPSQNFCSDCGTALHDTKKTKTETKQLSWLRLSIDEKLDPDSLAEIQVNAGDTVLIMNRKDPKINAYWITSPLIKQLPTESQVAESIALFKSAFDEQLKAIKRKTGQDVPVQYGLVVYTY